MKTAAKLTFSATSGLIVFGSMVFVPAGTLRYWQGWVFLAVFAVATWFPSGYLLRTNPAALQRRMRAGPFAETRPVQKIASAAAFVSFAGSIALSATDYRFGWSNVPAAICVLGDVLVVLGLGITMLVVVQNGYAAANVTVETGQRLASSGLYGLVRHPMYSGSVVLMIGIPLALGSYWGLVFVVAGLAVLVLRIRDEEALLTQELTGYGDYTREVRYRLLPHVW